jgi:RNA polymerase primary sigma factor
LVAHLEGREQRVAACLYGVGTAPLTMAETAQLMGLKRERVRQIRDKAVRQLCRMTTSKDLRIYLRR